MTTAESLKSITDRAKFEKIANAILRIRYPNLANLIASGLNEKNETVKSPLDAFAAIGKNQYAYIEHTTDDSDLEKKWLNEKQTKSSPLGDLIKAANIAREKRLENPYCEFLIFLVTNQKVSEKLESKVKAKVPEDFISIEIVELSILADFLDQHPIGQYFRKIYLNIDAELLSQPLLREISNQNISNYSNEIYTDKSSLVETSAILELRRELAGFTKNLAFVVAASGTGKSATALSLLVRTADAGHSSLRIDPKVIVESNGLIDAIEKQLKREYNGLFIQKDVIRQLFAGPSLIVIDDVNKLDNPATALEKIISWMQTVEKTFEELRILCPVWPRNLAQIENKNSKEKLFQTLSLGKLTRKDAIDFIRLALVDSTVTLTDPQTDAIVRDTVRDPLLLKFYLDHILAEGVYIPNYGQQIIESYINDKINTQSTKQGIPYVRYKSALESLGYHMLKHHVLNPTYDDIEKYFGAGNTDVSILEGLASQRFLLYFDNNGLTVFRHDRIRDYMLICSLQTLLQDASAYQSILEDLYYSELIGTAISLQPLPETTIDQLLSTNPLSVFYSLKYLQQDDVKDYFNLIAGRIQKRTSGLAEKPVPRALTDAISWALLQFDTKKIMEVTQGIPNSMELFLARFRNGDTASGILFLSCFTWFPPSTGNFWRDIILDHVRQVHFNETVKGLQHYLTQKLTDKARHNAYLLAGYLQSKELIPFLQQHWKDNLRNEDFLFYIWAVLNCFNTGNLSPLTEVLDYWKASENTKGEYRGSGGLKKEIPRELEYCRWKFNEERIAQLVVLAENPDYAKLIYAVLGFIDSPVAIKAIIQRMTKERVEKGDDWHERIRANEDRWDIGRRSVKLSDPSRQFLLDHWQNKDNPAKERYIAFRFWNGNEDPGIVMKEARTITHDDIELYDSSLFRRAELKDSTVIPEFIELIGRKWWAIRQIDKIWDTKLTEFFREFVRKAIEEKRADYMESVIAVLGKIHQKDAEEILIEFWDTIKLLHAGFVTALFIATPKTKELAAKEIGRLGFDNWEKVKDCYQGASSGHYIIPDESWDLSADEEKNAFFMAEEFKYAYFNYGYFTDVNNPELTSERLKSLEPYFILMEDHGLSELAEQCQRLNYGDWVRKIHPFLSRESKRKFLPSDEDIIQELKDIATGKRLDEIEEYMKALSKREVTDKRFIDCIETLVLTETAYEYLELICKCLEVKGTRRQIPFIEQFAVSEASLLDKAAHKKANTIFRILRNSIQ